MKFRLNVGLVSFVLMAMLTLNACKKDKGSSGDDEGEEGSDVSCLTSCSGGDEIGDLEIVSSIDQLNLSTALNIDAPETLSKVSGAETTLALVDGGAESISSPETLKSMEACEVGSNVKDGLERLNDVGGMFCHIEAEAANIEFGKKYKINISKDRGGENGTIAIWVDDSKKEEGKIKVSFCKAGKLQEVINIEGVDKESGAVKGRVKMRHIENNEHFKGEFKSEVTFDKNFTTSGKTFVSSYDHMKNTVNNSEHKRQLVLDINDSGVDHVFLAAAGTHNGHSFQRSGAARISDNYGQVVYKSSGTHNGNTFTFTRRASFNSEGFSVDSSSDAMFQLDGSLYVKDEEVPKLLDASFAIADFEAGEWDCTTEEEFDLNMQGAIGQAHAACDSRKNHTRSDCWDRTKYSESRENITIDASKQKGGKEFETTKKPLPKKPQ